MPADMQKLMQNKEAILRTITNRGPCLPVQIARENGLSLLFASAYLSELYNERKIKMSSMKVGSSSLYFISGQEAQLENFIQYLNHKEREAFTILKNNKLLQDSKMEPAIRVALRSIKDFAIPIKIKLEEEAILFWKHFLIEESELKDIAQKLLKNETKQNKQEDNEKQEKLVKETPIQSPEPPIEVNAKKVDKENENNSAIVELKQKLEEISNELKKPQPSSQSQIKIKPKKIKLVEESKFAKTIRAHMLSNNIELLHLVEEKKKEVMGKIRVDTLFGKQEYLLIGKEKKKVTEEDITIAVHKAQLEKMPVLFIAPGEIDKKSLDYAQTWKNIFKFEKLK